MNKLTFLLIIFLSSCVGKMVPTSFVQIRNNYKFEFQAKSLGKPWNIGTSNSENIGTMFVNLNDIHSDVELMVKISKVDKSIFPSQSRFKVSREYISEIDGEPLFFVDSKDCDEALMENNSVCYIRILAKYNKNNTEKDLRDGLDIKITEVVGSNIEAASEFNLSFDMHRKVPPKIIDFKTASFELGDVNYFASKKMEKELFLVEGEFNYTIESFLSSNEEEYSSKLQDINRSIKADLSLNYFDNVTNGFKDSILNVKILFENGEEELKQIPITAKRLSMPNFVFFEDASPNFKNKGEEKQLILKNNGETPAKLENISFLNNNAFNLSEHDNCIDKVLINEDVCVFKIKYNPPKLDESFQDELKIQALSDGVSLLKRKNIAGNISEPSELKAYLNDEEINSYDFLSILVNKQKSISIQIKNTKALKAEPDLRNIAVGNNAYLYNISSTCDIISKLDSCDLNITFQPREVANYSSFIEIPYTDATRESKKLKLNLSGLAKNVANLSFNPSIMDFKNLLKDNTLSYTCSSTNCDVANYVGKKEQILTIKNTGDWVAVISNIAPTGSYANLFTIPDATNNCKNKSLEKDEICTLKLIFDATLYSNTDDGIAIASTSLKVVYSDGNITNKELSSNLQGKVLLIGAPSLSYQDNSKSFGTRIINDYSDKLVTIKNDTTKTYIADIKILNNFTFTNSHSIGGTHWSITGTNNCTNRVLAKNETCSFTVRFRPQDLAYNYPVDTIMDFPYIGLALNHVRLALNASMDIKYDNYIDSNLNKNDTLTAYVGKNADLIIVGVSTATRNSTDETNINYHNYTKTLTDFNDASDEGEILNKLGIGNKVQGTNAFWDFDKAFSSTRNTNADFSIKFKNIGYQDARPTLSKAGNHSSFEWDTCSSITGVRSGGVSTGYCTVGFKFSLTGERTASTSSYTYTSGSSTVTRNIAYKKGSIRNETLDFKGFAVSKPQLKVFYRHIDTTSFTDATTSNFSFGDFLYKLGSDNTLKTYVFKASVIKSTEIIDDYNQNIKISSTSYRYIPATLDAFNFNDANLKIVRAVYDGEGTVSSVLDKSFSAVTGYEFDKSYTVDFGVASSDFETSITYTSQTSLPGTLCANSNSFSRSNLHRISFNDFNKYGASGTEDTKTKTFYYNVLPPLSISSGTCTSSSTYSGNGNTTVTLKNNSIFGINNIRSQTYGVCGTNTANAFQILFNGESVTRPDNTTFNCSVSNPCLKESTTNLAAGATCNMCLSYRDDGYSSGLYNTIIQDVNLTYDVPTKANSLITNLYLTNSISQSLFNNSGSLQTSTDQGVNKTYSTYSSGGICGTSSLKNSSDFYLKRTFTNSGSRTLDYRGYHTSSRSYFVPNSVGLKYLRSTSYEYDGSPFKIKIQSLTCGTTNLLTASQANIVSNQTCELIFQASTNTNKTVTTQNPDGTTSTSTVRETFDDLCTRHGSTLNFNFNYYYKYRTKTKVVSQSSCDDGSSDPSITLYLIGGPNWTNGF